MLALTPTRARTRDKQKHKKAEASNTSSSRVPQPYTLCETVGHPTNRFLELNKLKALLHAPKAPVNPPPPTGEKSMPTCLKTLHTNHACAICIKYDHYTHHCP